MTSLTFTALINVEYYIVLDTFDGQEASFSVTVTCS